MKIRFEYWINKYVEIERSYYLFFLFGLGMGLGIFFFTFLLKNSLRLGIGMGFTYATIFLLTDYFSWEDEE